MWNFRAVFGCLEPSELKRNEYSLVDMKTLETKGVARALNSGPP